MGQIANQMAFELFFKIKEKSKKEKNLEIVVCKKR